MTELVRAADVVFLSYLQAVLSAEGIRSDVLDVNMNAMVGMTNVLFPRRLVVASDDALKAGALLLELGVELSNRDLAAELKRMRPAAAP
jgi:hypothetical protein